MTKLTSAHPPSTANSLYADATSEPIYDDGRSEPVPPDATSTPPPSGQPYRKNAQELNYSQIEHLRNHGGHRRFEVENRAPKGGQSVAISEQMRPTADRKTAEERERDELFVDIAPFYKGPPDPKKPPPPAPKPKPKLELEPKSSGNLIYTSVVVSKAPWSPKVPEDREVVEYSTLLSAGQAKEVIDARATRLKDRMTGAGLQWPDKLDPHEAMSSEFGKLYLGDGGPKSNRLDAMCSELMKSFATPHSKLKALFRAEKSYGAVAALSETLAVLRSEAGKKVTGDLSTALDGSAVVAKGGQNEPTLIGLALHESLRRAVGGLSGKEREALERHAKSSRSGLQNEIDARTRQAVELWEKIEMSDDDNGLDQLKAAFRSVHVEGMALQQLKRIAESDQR